MRRLFRLEPETLGRLAEHGRESLGEAALDEWLLPVAAAWGFLFVGELDGEPAGSAQGFRCSDKGDFYLDCFYIRPRFRRRSLGTTLLGQVLQLLGHEGGRRLLVTADPENGAAMALYDAAGFQAVEELGDFYGKGRSRLLMAAALGVEEPR